MKNINESNVLTANEILAYDMFQSDIAGMEQMLTIAMQFYANRVGEIHKVRKQWWADIMSTRGLDKSKTYKVEMIDGICQVSQIQEDEE